MIEVVAVYEDAEIAYGRGDTYEDAAAEAAAQVPDVYPADAVVLECEHGIMRVETPLSVWLEFEGAR
jgi:hypothetical protein